MKNTLKTKAWITEYCSAGPDDLAKPSGIDSMVFNTRDMATAGWTYVGTAEITVDLVDRKTLVENKVVALKEELKTVRAEAHVKEMRLNEQINNLLALSFDPSVSA